jgi:peptidoglycan hydrolase FlgJ
MNNVNAIKRYTDIARPELPEHNVRPPMKDDPEVRDAFDNFFGQTFYGQMLSAMRKSQGKTPYFNGGRAEQVFQGQLDQQLAEEMSKANAHSFSGPMFDLFALQRT